MAQKKQSPKPVRPAPEESEVEDFMEIGRSPVPGIALRQVLHGHTGVINRVAWANNGQNLATPSSDKTTRIWDTKEGNVLHVMKGHTGKIYCAAWSPDNKVLASGSWDETIRLWDAFTGTEIRTIAEDHGKFNAITWSPNGRLLATGSEGTEVLIWDTESGKLVSRCGGHAGNINNLRWSRDGSLIAGASGDGTVRIWDGESSRLLHTLRGHEDWVFDISWFPNGKYLCSCSWDRTIRIWDTESGRQTKILEGHSSRIESCSISFDGNLLATKSLDNTVRLWSLVTYQNLATIEETSSGHLSPALAFHPTLPLLVTLGKEDTIARIWDIDFEVLQRGGQGVESIHYTTAKLVLVGDSGVGKTGLGWRLAHNEFREHSSTHGQQFWVIPQLGIKRKDGTECEAVLWDLAGQPDYRLIHSLYLDDVDTAMVLFDPTNRQEPLSGVDFWLNQLRDKDKKLRNTILVGARTDRGTSTLTESELQAYCERNGVSGGYISTSALRGDGLPELMEKLKAQIPWDQMTTTVTTITFKRIKEFVLALKEKTERKNVLVQPDGLRNQLQVTDRDWQFSDAEMMAAVGHLEHHGYVKIIHGSDGKHSILLTPDILANLASSIVLEARRNPRGLGVLEEARLLRGEYLFSELVNLSEEESKVLLDAAAVLFLERNLCFRETFGQQTFLVFPSLINEKRPLDETIRTEEGASYRVRGAVENIYASLVVLLGYTNTFIRTHQWQNQAQYEMGEGEVCGFQQAGYGDGGIELVLYYGLDTPESVRLMFRGMFERFLSRRELEISRYQPVKCPKCDSSLARNVVMDQLSKGKNVSFCHECGERVSLPNPEPLTRLSHKEEAVLDAQQAIAKRRTAFEAALVRVKGLLRDQGREKKPTCFISYAWGVSENERWVLQLAKDLRNADIDVLLDRWHSPPGSNLDLYIERIDSSDFVIAVGTPELRQKYDTRTADPVVAAELKLINLRVRQPTEYGETVLPVLLTGDARRSFTPQLQPLVSIDFREEDFYFRKLFDMIWRLYSLPFDNPLLEELQASMTPRENR